jgi:hypothetical protein
VISEKTRKTAGFLCGKMIIARNVPFVSKSVRVSGGGISVGTEA